MGSKAPRSSPSSGRSKMTNIEKICNMQWLKSESKLETEKKHGGEINLQRLSRKTEEEDYFSGTRNAKRTKNRKKKLVSTITSIEELDGKKRTEGSTTALDSRKENTTANMQGKVQRTRTTTFLRSAPHVPPAGSAWNSSGASVANLLFPDVKSTVIRRYDEEEMLSNALAESVANAQLERFRFPLNETKPENRWKELYGYDEGGGWDNIRRNLPALAETQPSQFDAFPAQKNEQDGNITNNNNSGVRNKSQRGNLKKRDVGREPDFRFKKESQSADTENESSGTSASAKKSVSFIENANSDTGLKADIIIDTPLGAKCIDRYGRIDGYSERHLFMGKGARRKEEEYIKQVCSLGAQDFRYKSCPGEPEEKKESKDLQTAAANNKCLNDRDDSRSRPYKKDKIIEKGNLDRPISSEDSLNDTECESSMESIRHYPSQTDKRGKQSGIEQQMTHGSQEKIKTTKQPALPADNRNYDNKMSGNGSDQAILNADAPALVTPGNILKSDQINSRDSNDEILPVQNDPCPNLHITGVACQNPKCTIQTMTEEEESNGQSLTELASKNLCDVQKETGQDSLLPENTPHTNFTTQNHQVYETFDFQSYIAALKAQIEYLTKMSQCTSQTCESHLNPIANNTNTSASVENNNKDPNQAYFSFNQMQQLLAQVIVCQNQGLFLDPYQEYLKNFPRCKKNLQSSNFYVDGSPPMMYPHAPPAQGEPNENVNNVPTSTGKYSDTSEVFGCTDGNGNSYQIDQTNYPTNIQSEWQTIKSDRLTNGSTSENNVILANNLMGNLPGFYVKKADFPNKSEDLEARNNADMKSQWPLCNSAPDQQTLFDNALAAKKGTPEQSSPTSQNVGQNTAKSDNTNSYAENSNYRNEQNLQASIAQNAQLDMTETENPTYLYPNVNYTNHQSTDSIHNQTLPPNPMLSSPNMTSLLAGNSISNPMIPMYTYPDPNYVNSKAELNPMLNMNPVPNVDPAFTTMRQMDMNWSIMNHYGGLPNDPFPQNPACPLVPDPAFCEPQQFLNFPKAPNERPNINLSSQEKPVSRGRGRLMMKDLFM